MLYFPKFLLLMDLFNSTLIPFALMLTFSILLIITIFKTRLRLLSFTSPNDRKKLIKDVKFSLTSIMLNFSYILLNLPICIISFYDFSDEIITFTYLLFCLNYCINFLILIVFNSIFRKECLVLFGIKQRNLSLSNI